MTAPMRIGRRKRAQTLNFLRILPRAKSSFSYRRKMMATAEPEIPGTMMARPMKKPSSPPLARSFLL